MHAFQTTHSAIEANASPKVFRLCGKPWDTRKHPYRRQCVTISSVQTKRDKHHQCNRQIAFHEFNIRALRRAVKELQFLRAWPVEIASLILVVRRAVDFHRICSVTRHKNEPVFAGIIHRYVRENPLIGCTTIETNIGL